MNGEVFFNEKEAVSPPHTHTPLLLPHTITEEQVLGAAPV